MTTTSRLFDHDCKLSIDPSNIPLGTMLRMHAIGMGANPEYDHCIGKLVENIDSRIGITIESAPNKIYGINGNKVEFGLAHSTWAFEIIMSEWDF